jgi:nitrogen fixation NifU-like protein
MMSDLRELYQEVILDHNKNPRNFHAIVGATHSVKGFNPLCGDQYTIHVKIEDGIVKEIGFEGSGCAISKASASVMTSVVKGKTVAEALELFDQFHDLVTASRRVEDVEKLGKLAPFSGVSEFPARVKCAILPWHTMKSAIEAKEEVVTTE